jgi:hypothetical protein
MPTRTPKSGSWATSDFVGAADLNKDPGGWVGYEQVTASQNGITGVTDLTGLSITFTAVANRRYRTTFSGEINGSVAGDLLIAYITDGAGTSLRRGVLTVPALISGAGYSQMTLQYVFQPSAGSITHKVRLERNAGTGNANLFATTTSPAFILIEDLGPSS